VRGDRSARRPRPRSLSNSARSLIERRSEVGRDISHFPPSILHFQTLLGRASGALRVGLCRLCPSLHFSLAKRVPGFLSGFRPDRPVDRSREVGHWGAIAERVSAMGWTSGFDRRAGEDESLLRLGSARGIPDGERSGIALEEVDSVVWCRAEFGRDWNCLCRRRGRERRLRQVGPGHWSDWGSGSLRRGRHGSSVEPLP
jgi:hypothetical protein